MIKKKNLISASLFKFLHFLLRREGSLTRRNRDNVPLVTFTKCIRIAILAVAAHAGEYGGNQSLPRQVR